MITAREGKQKSQGTPLGAQRCQNKRVCARRPQQGLGTSLGTGPSGPAATLPAACGPGEALGDLCTAAPAMFRVAQALEEAATGPAVPPELPRCSPAPSWWAPQHGEGRAPRGAHPGGTRCVLRSLCGVTAPVVRHCPGNAAPLGQACARAAASPTPHCCPWAYRSRREFSVSVSGWRC